MKPPIEHIRLSSQAKDQLIRLKRDTGIANWNVLCRWAFLLSCADKTRPETVDLRTDSNVEMSWKVFCGDHQVPLESIFFFRCSQDNIATESERTVEFRKHLGRGIGMLCGMQKRLNLAALVEAAIKQEKDASR